VHNNIPRNNISNTNITPNIDYGNYPSLNEIHSDINSLNINSTNQITQPTQINPNPLPGFVNNNWTLIIDRNILTLHQGNTYNNTWPININSYPIQAPTNLNSIDFQHNAGNTTNNPKYFGFWGPDLQKNH
jgi:hypothetical protein